MKTLLLFLLCISVCSDVWSQTSLVLTSERNAYRPGDEIIKQQVIFRDPGSRGKDLIWDFRHLQAIDEEYSLRYFIPDSIVMNILCGMEHRTRYYYDQRNDSLWATGYENPTTYMEYVKPELKMIFPFTYGDTLRSEFEGVGEYGRRLKLSTKGYTSIEADAEGELILPDATVKKALRVRSIRHYTQVSPKQTETDQEAKTEMILDTYSWYAQGMRYPVFESIKTSILRNNTDTALFTTSFYYAPLEQKLQIAEDGEEQWDSPASEELEGAASVFTEADLIPNPVVDVLYIKYRLTRDARVGFSVHNNLGFCMARVPAQQQADGYHETPINMRGFMTGTYALYVYVDDMVMSLNVVKK